MHLYHGQGAATAANDPLFRAQPAAIEWRLNDLHQIATGHKVRVAVIDSMVEVNHPDLKGQVELLKNFVSGQSDAPERHGTGVAGIIAARADNGSGIAGIAPQARLLALRACWQTAQRQVETLCNSLSLAEALHFAIDHQAQVINLSLSGPQDALLSRLLDIARQRGITVVAAYDTALPHGGFPASQAGVIAVAEESLEAVPAGVYRAPGRDVPTTQPGGRWFLVNGASFSAAHVSGLMALVRERSRYPPGAASLLISNLGGGKIDTCATLLKVVGPCDCACSHPIGASAIARQ